MNLVDTGDQVLVNFSQVGHRGETVGSDRYSRDDSSLWTPFGGLLFDCPFGTPAGAPLGVRLSPLRPRSSDRSHNSGAARRNYQLRVFDNGAQLRVLAMNLNCEATDIANGCYVFAPHGV